MVSRYWSRWFFVLTALSVLFFCWWNFRAHLRTSSDPFQLIPENAKWVWVVQDWDGVLAMKEDVNRLPFLNRYFGDLEIWKEWSASSPDIQLLLNQACILWASSDSLMEQGYWCFGIPDNWSDSRIEQLCKQVPHLMRKGEGVIWSLDGQNLNLESFIDDESLEKWKSDFQTIDHSSALSVLGVNSMCRFAMENRKGDWWGYISSSTNILGNEPLDTLVSLKKGEWCSAAYIKRLIDYSQDSVLRKESGSFNVDTACQCSAWDMMHQWQPLVGTVHFTDESSVIFSQGYDKNPIRSFRKLFLDTTKVLMKIQNKRFLSGAIYPDLKCEWAWMTKRKGQLVASTDSAALVSYIADTAHFEGLRFEHSFPNHPVLLGYHRNAVQNALMPVNWSLIKGENFATIQVYLAAENRWVVQLNPMR